MTEAEAAQTAYFIGDVAQDDYYRAERWPGVADKAYIEESRSYVGGMIANAACVHAGFGGRTEFISLLNHSPLSQQLCDELGRKNVATSHMLYDPGVPNSRCMIFLVGGEHVVLFTGGGDQPMSLPPAAMQALRAPGYLYTTLDRAKRLVASDRGADLTGAAVLADLRAHGRRVVFDLDVDGFAAEDFDYLRGAHVVIMNQVGFEHAYGTPDLARINSWMREHQVQTVIRTLAADGAQAYDGKDVIEVRGYDVPVADVTGAGDTFGGALVYALPRMADLRAALDFAIAAAARSVMIEGPQGGVATPEMVEQFRRDFAGSISVSHPRT